MKDRDVVTFEDGGRQQHRQEDPSIARRGPRWGNFGDRGVSGWDVIHTRREDAGRVQAFPDQWTRRNLRCFRPPIRWRFRFRWTMLREISGRVVWRRH